MPLLKRRHYFLVLAATALLGLAWRLFLPSPAPPGSMEDLYSQVQLGMTHQQIIDLIWGCRDVDVLLTKGYTRNGKPFGGYGSLELLEPPPPETILRCQFKVEDADGWEVEVTLGPGGTVTAKRSIPPDNWTYLRRRLLGHPRA